MQLQPRPSPMALSWMSEMDYLRIAALTQEAEWVDDKVRQLKVWLDDDLSELFYLGDESLGHGATNIEVTYDWMEDDVHD